MQAKLVRILLFRDGQIGGWERGWGDSFLFVIKAIQEHFCVLKAYGKFDTFRILGSTIVFLQVQ